MTKQRITFPLMARPDTLIAAVCLESPPPYRRTTWPSIAFAAAAVLLSACARPDAGAAGPGAQERAGTGAPESHVLNIATRYEVARLLPKAPGVGDPFATVNAFNAALTQNDETGSVRAFLAEVPQLDSDTWQVLADGRMDTTYKLRPGLTWQDGQPLSAEDFVFARRVYANPGLGVFPSNPQNLIESIDAPDARTLVIHWRSPYPDAGRIALGDLDPLPRHILLQPFAALEQDPSGADAFLSLPFWRAEYIGAGPYRMTHWEPGSHFEGAAFDGYVLGRPKIDRITIRIIGDDQVSLTNLLAGTVDWAIVRAQQFEALNRDWVPARKGSTVRVRGNIVSQVIQLRPEYVGHPALLDVRVRRALAHSVDRQAINEGAFDGQGLMTETIVPETASFYPEIGRAIVHYPYDPRRSEQLMADGGFTKDRDGFFANAGGERYRLDFQRDNGSDAERLQLIQMDTWQRAGFEVRAYSLPAAQTSVSGEQRNTFPGIQSKGGGTERDWITSEIGTPENRWTGGNRAAWSNPEYDRLYEAVTTTLDPTERVRQFAQMQRLLTEELPAIFTHFGFDALAYTSALQGPKGETAAIGNFTPRTVRNFNIHEWVWQ